MKKIIIAIAAGLALVAIAYLITKHNDAESALFEANVEALARNEAQNYSGRYRTVGCGSYAFIDWKTYCCPNEDWHNCPDAGTCKKKPIYGCD